MVKITCLKSIVQSGKSCHKEHTRQIWKPYLLEKESYKQTRSVTDGQTDIRADKETGGQTDRRTDERTTDKVIPKWRSVSFVTL